MEIPVVKIHRYFLQPTSGIPLASMGKLPLNGNLLISPIGKLPLHCGYNWHQPKMKCTKNID